MVKEEEEEELIKTDPFTGPNTTVHPSKPVILTAVKVCNISFTHQNKINERKEEKEKTKKRRSEKAKKK